MRLSAALTSVRDATNSTGQYMTPRRHFLIQAPTRLRPLLGLATLTLMAIPALAQDNPADNASNTRSGAKPAWHTGYALIDDSHLSLHLRNLYKAGTSTPDAGLPPNYHTSVQASSL